MSFPAPKAGLVIRYAFLWSHEEHSGAQEASKDRPCAIVIAVPRRDGGDLRVIVAPVTHAPPTKPSDSLELPPTVCRSLGLDSGRHWLRLDELNLFSWPGYDLRTIPGKPGIYAYGMLPQSLFEQIRRAILERQRVTAPRIQARD